MHLIVTTVLLLGALALIGAVALYATVKKFNVKEDPRVAEVERQLAGANCGGCGLSGCHAFAVKCVQQGNLDGMQCPGSGPEALCKIAEILGCTATVTERRLAVLKCNGSCSARPQVYNYDGTRTCAVMDAVGTGTAGCSYGCLGCGDCVQACMFTAIHMDPATHLPVVNPEKCTACGACVKECPRHLLELRPAGRRDRRVWVACSSRDRGAVARKVCAAACIGCGKCMRTCPFGAIEVSGNLAYINPVLCKACGKCVGVCPTGAILSSFKPVTANEKDL